MSEDVLTIKNLQTAFDTERGRLTAVDGVSFTVPAGKTVGIVGESGCGKSVTAMSIVQLLPQPAGVITGGEVIFKGKNLVGVDEETLYGIRGNEIGLIFQEPMTAQGSAQSLVLEKSIQFHSLVFHKEFPHLLLLSSFP